MTKTDIQWKDLLTKKIVICFFTGFTSGLPLFILISLLPAWLDESGLDLKAIRAFCFNPTSICMEIHLGTFIRSFHTFNG